MSVLHKNLTPFFWGPKATSRKGREVEMAVCVRGVFRLAPGEPLTPIEDSMAQGFMSGEQWSPKDPERQGPSVRHDDFADWKPRVDLLLKGTCHPPRGADVVCDVAFGVGAWSKTLRVHGPRAFTPGVLFGGTVSEPQPFRSMPLTWENAYGGPGFPDNPVGRGHVGPELPTVEDPRAPVTRTGQKAAPACFLPVSSQWPARRGKTGKNYGKRWEETRAPFVADDFDWSYFNAAPLDQQVDALRGDEVVWFQHLHPAAPRFEVRLPGLRLRALVKRTDGTVHDLKFALDTLYADTDAGRLELLWRAHCPVKELDLTDVKVALIASEPLAEPPRPGAHYLPLLEAFEADPVGIKDAFPPGFLEVAEAVKAAEKAELEGGPKPDFAAVAARLPKDSPVPAWAVAALGSLDDPLVTLRAAAAAVGAQLPADPAALAALAQRVEQGSKDPAALAEQLEALAAQLGPEQGAGLMKAAGALRQAKPPPPATTDPAAALEALAAGLPPETAATLRGAAAALRKGLAEAAAAATKGGADAAALLAAAAPGPAAPPAPLPVQLAALSKQLEAAATAPGAPPEVAGPAKGGAAQVAGLPAAVDAQVGAALAPLAQVKLPPPPDARAVIEKVLAGLDKDEAAWRRRLGDHPLLGLFALAKGVTARAGEKLARAKGPDGGAVAAGVGGAADALAKLGVSAAALAPLRGLAEQVGAFAAGAAGAPWPPVPPTDLAEQDLSGRDLAGVDLEGRCLARAKLARSRLVGARLARADLEGADLSGCDLEGADLLGANLRGAKLPRARLVRARIEGADLGDADLSQADLTQVHGPGAVLCGALLEKAVLEGAQLAQADLTGALLPAARLANADLSGARLEQAIATKADLRGARLVEARLGMADLGKADLTGADLSQADLAMASMGQVKGDGLKLAGAALEMTQLGGARLRGADLRGARGSLTTLGGCDLTGADLRGLRLDRSSLDGARLDEADLTGATLEQVNLRDVRAARAKLVDVKAPGLSVTGEAALEQCDLRRLSAPRSTWFGVTLAGCDLSHADLSHGLLQELKATDTSFFAATLKRAVLRKAKLRRARFVRADLGAAELVGAELLDVQFTGANLWDAKFIEATLASCDFLEAGLVRARFDRAQGEVPT